MNKVILMGRLTRDPEIRYMQDQTPIARYTLAVDRRTSEGQIADFIPCVAFGKPAELAEKYFYQGIKLVISGSLRTGSYTDKEGRKVYTTDVIVESQEFAESKKENEPQKSAEAGKAQASARPERYVKQTRMEPDRNGFLQLPDDADGLPFA